MQLPALLITGFQNFFDLVKQDAPTIVILWGIVSKTGSAIISRINQIVTSNNNRIRDDLRRDMQNYIDEKFQTHETSAFGRLEQLSEQVARKRSGGEIRTLDARRSEETSVPPHGNPPG